MGAIEDTKSVKESLNVGIEIAEDCKALGNMRENLVRAYKLISLNIDEYELTHDFNRLIVNLSYTSAYMKQIDMITGEAMIRTIWIGVKNQIDMIVSSYASDATRNNVARLLIANPPHVEETTRSNPIQTLSGVTIVLLNGEEKKGAIVMIDTSKGTMTGHVKGMPFFPVKRDYNSDDSTYNQTGW